MKKGLILILAMVLTMNIAACGSNGQETTAAPETAVSETAVSEEAATEESPEEKDTQEEETGTSEAEGEDSSVETTLQDDSEVYPPEGMDGGDEDDAAEYEAQRQSAFDGLMNEINGVHPGTAGTSLKSESAANTLVDFARNYGQGADAGTFTTMTDSWMNSQGGIDSDDFRESLASVDASALYSDSSLAEDPAYQAVKTGIEAALN